MFFRHSQSLEKLAKVVEQIKKPEALAQHDPRIQKLARLAVAGKNPRWSRYLTQELLHRSLHFQTHPEPFIKNVPPRGTFAQLPPNHVPLARLLTGEVLPFSVGNPGISGNTLIIGPTGSGKTTCLLNLIRNITQTRQAIVICFDRKGDLARLVETDRTGQVIGLSEKDLKLALFQRF